MLWDENDVVDDYYDDNDEDGDNYEDGIVVGPQLTFVSMCTHVFFCNHMFRFALNWVHDSKNKGNDDSAAAAAHDVNNLINRDKYI